MDHNPEIEFHLSELFGSRNSDEQLCAESIQKRTDAFDALFERIEIEKYLGHSTQDDLSKTVGEIFGGAPIRDQPELDDLRNFVKAEKQRVPTMTSREVRSSVVNLLRKTADAMAGT